VAASDATRLAPEEVMAAPKRPLKVRSQPRSFWPLLPSPSVTISFFLSSVPSAACLRRSSNFPLACWQFGMGHGSLLLQGESEKTPEERQRERAARKRAAQKEKHRREADRRSVSLGGRMV